MVRCRKLISIVTPVYNEAHSIDVFLERLIETLAGVSYRWEVICVNDGSTDASLAKVTTWAERVPHVKIVDLARNFGKEVAITAGLDHACGDAVVLMDSDLQHPPGVVPELLKKWQEGFEGVYAVRENRDDETRAKELLTRAYYFLLRGISETPAPADAGDFRLMDRCMVDALSDMPERARFMKGLYAWVGFRQIGVTYQVGQRIAGESKWPLYRLWSLGLEGLVSFSSLPLKIWSYLGFLIASLSLLYAVVVLVDVLIHGSDPAWDPIGVDCAILSQRRAIDQHGHHRGIPR